DADTVRAVRDVRGQAEDDQERQRDQRAASGERVDEARHEADDRHRDEQQLVGLHEYVIEPLPPPCGASRDSRRMRGWYSSRARSGLVVHRSGATAALMHRESALRAGGLWCNQLKLKE